jgi:hypothetical protein
VFTDVTSNTVSVNALAETIVKELEMATDFKQGGALATDYANATSDLLSYLKNNPNVSKDVQNLISVYSADVSNLATSITYDLSYPMIQKLNSYINQEYTEVVNAIDAILALLPPGSAGYIQLQDLKNDISVNDWSKWNSTISALTSYLNAFITNAALLTDVNITPGTNETTITLPTGSSISFKNQLGQQVGIYCTGGCFSEGDCIQNPLYSTNPYLEIDGVTVYDKDDDIDNSVGQQTFGGVKYTIFQDPNDPTKAYAVPLKEIYHKRYLYPGDSLQLFSSYYSGDHDVNNFYSTSESAIITINNFSGMSNLDLGDMNMINIAGSLTALTNALATLNAVDINIADALAAMLAEGTITADFIVQNIHVFTEGNYNEILNCSYDASVLQELLEGDSSTIASACGLK